MQAIGIIFGVVTLMGVSGLLFRVVVQQGRQATDPADYLRSLDQGEVVVDEFQRRLAQPFLSRVLRPLGAGLFHRIGNLTPSNYLDQVHRRLLLAGLSNSIRAEEFVTAQVLSTAFGGLLAVLWSVFGEPAGRMAVVALVLLPTVGALMPRAWLNRKVSERHDAILKDLPDVLDLMAISVEAGVGFEGAMEVVCQHFTSPLAEEMSRTLQEMELGLSRREALQNLKRRTEVPELSNFVLALTQADVLGMPIGRVLKTQAAEMRSKRRQWAREKAGKLPVKMLVPLVIFIFPAILVIVLGPAMSSIAKNL